MFGFRMLTYAGLREERILFRPGNRVSVLLAALCVSWLALGTGAGRAEEACKFELSREHFDRRSGPALQISASFIQPPRDADSIQLKQHFLHTRLLGRYLSRQAYTKSSRRCSFLPMIDASGGLDFELVSINDRVHDECSLRWCASLIARTLEADGVNPSAFAQAVSLVTDATRRFETPDLRYPKTVASRAAHQAYLEIYPPESRERIFVDVSSQDYQKVQFADFNVWVAKQRRQSESDRERQVSPVTTDQPDNSCSMAPDVMRIDVRRPSPGYEAIILLNYGAENVERAQPSSLVLNALCGIGEKPQANLLSEKLSSFSNKISCSREQLHRDRWLLIFGKEYSSPNVSELDQLAHELRGALAALGCSDRRLSIYLAKFLRTD